MTVDRCEGYLNINIIVEKTSRDYWLKHNGIGHFS